MRRDGASGSSGDDPMSAVADSGVSDGGVRLRGVAATKNLSATRCHGTMALGAAAFRCTR